MDDPVVAVLPIHLSNSLVPNLHLHQFPLLFRPLQVPPSAAESGKRIRARLKPRVGRIEIHVPVDTRKEVWNPEKGIEYGAARAEGDQESNTHDKKEKNKQKEGEEPRLSEVRMSSERVPERGDYMLGIVRDGHLHLHPISETHQLRPTLTYLDVLSRKSRRSRASAGADGDSDSDDGPPPDPDDPTPAAPVAKKDKRPTTESKEVQVTAKKTSEDKTGMQQFQGGLSQVRREMLMMMRDEAEEAWEELEYCDGEHEDSADAFESVFSKESVKLTCKTDMVDLLKNIMS
ncbi:DNA-directed RNA polymerase III subunit Rpc5 [Gautieria morchelliformis]|nr:DNA-directed RNA polymerase III subunit Rpc5 [Gautieria morchelliformis]